MLALHMFDPGSIQQEHKWLRTAKSIQSQNYIRRIARHRSKNNSKKVK